MKHKIDVPIFQTVDAILSGTLSPKAGVAKLMERDPKPEGFELSCGHLKS
jgi:glycerol-3-phosphate dehydrogenase